MTPLNQKAINSYQSLVDLMVAFRMAHDNGGLQTLIDCGYLAPSTIHAVNDAVIAFVEG